MAYSANKTIVVRLKQMVIQGHSFQWYVKRLLQVKILLAA
jgi:hypothetical protein